jgi:streptogramin lyase
VTQFSSLPPNASPFNVETTIVLGARGELWAAGTVLLSKQPASFRLVSGFSRASVFTVTGIHPYEHLSIHGAVFASDGNVWFADSVNSGVAGTTEDGTMFFVSTPRQDDGRIVIFTSALDSPSVV